MGANKVIHVSRAVHEAVCRDPVYRAVAEAEIAAGRVKIIDEPAGTAKAA